MKPLTVLLCLFLLGCEKRVADPELEAVKEWLLVEENQTQIADALAAFPEWGRPKSLELFPGKSQIKSSNA